MSAKAAYRTAAVIFLLFAALHTFGFLSLQPPTPESAAVWTGMNTVRMNIDGSSYSYGEFYRSFGLSATTSMLLCAFLCWYLGGIVKVLPKAAVSIGWALCLYQVAGVALAALYVSAKPATFSAVLVVLLAWAAWKSGRASERPAGVASFETEKAVHG